MMISTQSLDLHPDQDERPEKTLFREAMRGDWAKVVHIYRLFKGTHTAKLTHTSDTALHIAVAEGDPEVVKELLDALGSVRVEDHIRSVLNQQNERGDTPLHSAARLGMAEVCCLLAAACPELVTGARSQDGETPLFAGADHGKMKVFFVLQRAIDAAKLNLSETDTISYCRRSTDGCNILHRAIYGEYFELAFEILHIYPQLVNTRNEKGESPLHLLAAKPSAFRSGSHIRFLDRLIYTSTIVDPLTPKYPTYEEVGSLKVLKAKEDKSELSKSYRVCLDLKLMLVSLSKVIVAQFRSYRRENQRMVKDDKVGNLNSVEIIISGVGVEQEERTTLEKASQFPPNYVVCFNFLKVALKFLLVVLGIGVRKIEKIRRKKQRHHYAYQLTKELIKRASFWESDHNGEKPPSTDIKEILRLNKQSDELKRETPILLAAKMGIIELVKRILDAFPIAVYDLDKDNKNVILLAAEYRQPHIFKCMLQRQEDKMSIFGMVDKEGNSAAHLAAKKSDQVQPWDIPGEALQMHWEIKWYKFIKDSIELNFYLPNNDKGQCARTIFNEAHKELVESASKWMRETSTACSVVATLIAAVAFTSATTVPGGVKQSTGFPVLEGRLAFSVFAISALIALCFSVSSLVMFLAIITSRYQAKDFETNLPLKLIIGLTALFASIGAMLVSFCGGHFYVIQNRLSYASYAIYGATCIPVLLFLLAQFPLYFDLIKASITHVPERIFRGRAI